MLPAASVLLSRVIREEIDRLATITSQWNAEYVTRQAYVFRGKHQDGHKRDQIYVVAKRAERRTGIPFREIIERRRGTRPLGGDGGPGALVWYGSTRDAPDLMTAHEQRMEETRERRAAEELKPCTCAAHLPHCPTPDNCVRQDASPPAATPSAAR